MNGSPKASDYCRCAPREPRRLDMTKIIGELDALFGAEDTAGAERLLLAALAEAKSVGDRYGELSVLSELMGLFRRLGDGKHALRVSLEGEALVKGLGLGRTVGGATVLLNAATTLAAFGETVRALELFSEVRDVYSSRLDPDDKRLSGFYNNMGTALAAHGDRRGAEECYLAALEGVKRRGDLPELAVTHINLAELYADGDEERVDMHVSAAMEALEAAEERNGYYAFTCRKCAPTLDRLGYFRYAKILNERADEIYGRS